MPRSIIGRQHHLSFDSTWFLWWLLYLQVYICITRLLEILSYIADHCIVWFFCFVLVQVSFIGLASAYNHDDTLYRLVTRVHMHRALVIAAGIPLAFFKKLILTSLFWAMSLCGRYWFAVATRCQTWSGTTQYDLSLYHWNSRYSSGRVIFSFLPIDFSVHFLWP